MFRLSKLTDYSVVVLSRLCIDGAVQTSPCIAAATGIPEPTVAKVLKTLTTHGLVTSTRGARGGYRLERAPTDISIAEVISAIDGPIALTACVDGGLCSSGHHCPMHGAWNKVNHAIRSALTSITLADMITPANPFLAHPISVQAASMALPCAATEV